MIVEFEVICSPIVLARGVSIDAFMDAFLGGIDGHNDVFDVYVNPNGTYELSTGPRHFRVDIVEELSTAAFISGEMVEKPFFIEVINNEAGTEDERRQLIFGGPTQQSIESLKRAVALNSILDQLQGSGLEDIAKPIKQMFDDFKVYMTDSTSPVVMPAAMVPKAEGDARYFKTLVTYEVLSEDEPLWASGGTSALNLHHQITDGDCSGVCLSVSSVELDAKQMRSALECQGSDSGFFISLAEGEEDEKCDQSP